MKETIPAIHFHFLRKRFSLKCRKHLKTFLRSIFQNEDVLLNELQYIFCSDTYLLGINSSFLKHDEYTDIITFSLAEPEMPITGEIYISIDRIKENTEIFKTSFNHELHRVIIHGILHLCGYKDKTKTQQKNMRAKEDYYLRRYFVPRETI